MRNEFIVIWKESNHRIIEIEDFNVSMSDLKGDCFDPEVNPGLDPEVLKADEERFEQRVSDDGVYGYALQEWDPEVDAGWTHKDSCFGFVGRHAVYDHYIVGELKGAI